MVVRNMLRGFKALTDSSIYEEERWNNRSITLPLPRINMPVQTTSGIGAGSCGVGVILTVRDMVRCENCLPSFDWSFDQMTHLRKDLMALILQWRS